ncbi:hypothetical protein HS7_14360 [Sulfolobales archaeon HS-7]|nr:hypothetical protein HS7_14360 [Sulfolobales archaeon HS-7]
MNKEGYSGKDLVEATNKIDLEDKLKEIYFFVRTKGGVSDKGVTYEAKYINIERGSRNNFIYIREKISTKLEKENIINECADFESKKPCYIDLDILSSDPQIQAASQIQANTSQQSGSYNTESDIMKLIQMIKNANPPTDEKFSPENDTKNTKYVAFKLSDEGGDDILIFSKFDRNIILKNLSILHFFKSKDTYEAVNIKDYIILEKNILFTYYKGKIIIFTLSKFQKDSNFKKMLVDYYINNLKKEPNFKKVINIVDNADAFERGLREVDPLQLRNLNKVVKNGITEIEQNLNTDPKIIEKVKNEYENKTQRELKVEFDEQNKKFIVDKSRVEDLIKIITDKVAETLLRRRVVEVSE